MLEYLETMNDNQKEAILTTEGPLIILAGAGSGKTRVLTHRIMHLIKEKKINESNILAITFTNKAANEMKERIFNLIGDTTKYIWINTFHAMCLKILRTNIEYLGYKTNFTILDNSEQKRVIKDIIENYKYDIDQYNPNFILKVISNSKNKNESPEDLSQKSKFGFMKNVSNIYLKYQQYLKKNNVLDFDDLIIKTIELFEKSDETLKYYQNKFKYIHVDEYQDTSIIQYKLIKLLSNFHKNICVVGDDDQSIYSWRGANVNNITDFEKDFKDSKIIYLNQNYRSNNIILSAANSIIKNNIKRKEKKLWTNIISDNKINFNYAENDIEEADYISKKIKKLNNYNNTAILYRNNYLSRVIENSLIKNSIPYKILGSLHFLNRKEIKDILSYINVLINPDDELSIKRIINVPKRGIGKETLKKIEIYMQQNKINMYEALKNVKDIRLSTNITKKIVAFIEIFEKYKNFNDYSIAEILEGIYIDSGYKEMLEQTVNVENRERISNISELVSSSIQYSKNNKSILEFMSDISLYSDTDKNENNKDNSVTLSTIHASKGLEYDTVFIIGLEENIFPSNIMEDDTDIKEKIEEERRLAYVAITRAKNNLFISATKRRMKFGKNITNKLSRFITEIPNNLVITNNENKTDLYNASTISIPIIKEKNVISKSNKKFSINDKVSHKKFGTGTVIDINDKEILINFLEYGEKTLLLEYANLLKE
ncbi:ATP-dependent helicase [Gemelliphila asaccharolytica]|uniref:DNA 3'-5' helicase n=1 Tax=Gemelliphila asaccharolytica TaxID=502393 RepID=A0ABR5TPQ9_9BACL|nr:UvrD-helicase domain-containing protein [Gemella asaccharolytica]KXB58612.1 putative ATP-dependent DNA helicase PcrA [Gemella asaccharolytica]